MLLFRRQRSNGKFFRAVRSVVPPQQRKRHHRHRHRKHPDQFNCILQLAAHGGGVIAQRTALASGLAALPFMRTLLIENERRYPVTPAMPKLALCDIELGGHVIPQGSEVLHLFALSHFDSTLYDDPFAFRPERWLSGGLVRPHAFGGGEHLCLGMNLSTLFVVLTLQVLLQQGNLSAAGLPYSKPVADTPYAPTRPAFTISLAAPSSPL